MNASTTLAQPAPADLHALAGFEIHGCRGDGAALALSVIVGSALRERARLQ